MRRTFELASIVVLLVICPASAFADSRCVSLQANALVNECDECSDVTVRELRPPAQHAAGPFSGVTRNVRLQGKTRQALETSGSWMISDLKVCQ